MEKQSELLELSVISWVSVVEGFHCSIMQGISIPSEVALLQLSVEELLIPGKPCG